MAKYTPSSMKPKLNDVIGLIKNKRNIIKIIDYINPNVVYFHSTIDAYYNINAYVTYQDYLVDAISFVSGEYLIEVDSESIDYTFFDEALYYDDVKGNTI